MMEAVVYSRVDDFPIFVIKDILELNEMFMVKDEYGAYMIVFYKGADLKTKNFYFHPEIDSVKFITKD